jgi:hypothetical protein
MSQNPAHSQPVNLTPFGQAVAWLEVQHPIVRWGEDLRATLVVQAARAHRVHWAGAVLEFPQRQGNVRIGTAEVLCGRRIAAGECVRQDFRISVPPGSALGRLMLRVSVQSGLWVKVLSARARSAPPEVCSALAELLAAETGMKYYWLPPDYAAGDPSGEISARFIADGADCLFRGARLRLFRASDGYWGEIRVRPKEWRLRRVLPAWERSIVDLRPGTPPVGDQLAAILEPYSLRASKLASLPLPARAGFSSPEHLPLPGNGA